MMRQFPVLLLAPLVLTLGSGSGCQDHGESLAADRNDVAEAAPEDVVKATNRFAFDVYAKLHLRHEGNLSFSPFGLSSGLAMLSAGARGETKEEITRTLRFPLPETKMRLAFKALLTELSSREEGGYRLDLANRLWGQQGYDFSAAFITAASDFYKAGPGRVDFAGSSEAARREINAWVEERTREKIKDFLPDGAVDHSTRLVLTSAIYFQGEWDNPFPRKYTKTAPFRVSCSEHVNVPMMLHNEEFSFAPFDGLKLLEMPYKGGEASMIVLLPDEGEGLGKLEQLLSAERLEEWRKRLKKEAVIVALPRFQIKSRLRIAEILGSMGMRLPFSDRADFSGMSDRRDLVLSTVLHQAHVEVNEEGTEATSATGAVMTGRSMPLIFRADHPFLFLILHKRTGTVLFLGRVHNPLS